ncbi:MAG: 3-oxoacyl-[acyl-carrier-protein] reductase [Psychroflexus sp.]|jgi:3-oxoacyl-[acyl-carrier protein] reductase|nr:3-oxoacyl-[acyl-carrier-protein] reductase [Psychroflexus sp.]MDR9448670.1 3-oxoacyl-[acyl-carrier-protein] reductase [Psychroflexus sp.]
MSLLKDKNVLITGGSRGIGKGIVEVLAEHGAQVGFTYHSSQQPADELVEKLEQNGTKAKAYQSDASDFNQAEKLVKDFVEDFGSIDVLINNAGITKDNLLMRMNEDDFNAVIQTNLNSVFNLTKASLRPFLKQRSGSIINISSVVGLKGNPGQANYAASKSGIIGFTKSVALELGSRSVRANVVAPGFIETEMTDKLDEKTVQTWRDAIPLKRGGTPEDVANTCLYLASDLSSYVTGQVLQVDGGMLT